MLPSFPAILQYGATGLAAILAFLAYRLLLHQSEKPKPDKMILRSVTGFMYASIALAVVSGTISLIDTALRLRPEVEALRRDKGQLQEKLDDVTQKMKSEADVSKRQTEQNSKALDRAVAQKLNEQLRITRDKLGRSTEDNGGLSEDVINDRRLRYAAFLNMGEYQGRADVLERSLHLVAKWGEQWITEARIRRVVADLPELKQFRLKWIDDALHDRRQTGPRAQGSEDPRVPYPDEVRILPKDCYLPWNASMARYEPVVALKAIGADGHPVYDRRITAPSQVIDSFTASRLEEEAQILRSAD